MTYQEAKKNYEGLKKRQQEVEEEFLQAVGGLYRLVRANICSVKSTPYGLFWPHSTVETLESAASRFYIGTIMIPWAVYSVDSVDGIGCKIVLINGQKMVGCVEFNDDPFHFIEKVV